MIARMKALALRRTMARQFWRARFISSFTSDRDQNQTILHISLMLVYLPKLYRSVTNITASPQLVPLRWRMLRLRR
jgi:hypothetical protein